MLISSDTNIWLDFEAIDCLEHPFLLDNKYYLSDVTFHDEIQFSEKIRAVISTGKLNITGVSASELRLALKYTEKYLVLSVYDAIALAIAKSRGWILLTGDSGLREAAEKELVEYHGTLWIYSHLKRENKLTSIEYKEALRKLLDAVESKKRRLPKDKILLMIEEAEENTVT